MPRAGQNPMKQMARRFEPKRVTACTIVYIPELAGYWEQSLAVLEVCLSSMRSSTDVPFDLVVLDNGSCPEVRRYLIELNEKGTIQILILSNENMGKVGAWNVLFPACPGEIIAFCDSDILFRRGWLERSIEALEAFPEAGMITGRPSRTSPERVDELLSATHRYASERRDVTVRKGQLIDPSILDEFARSVAPSTDPALTDPTITDLEITRHGVSAIAYAGHYQFVTTRKATLEVLPIETERAVGGSERMFDERLNARGFLRLGLTTPLVHHLGNTLSESELAELTQLHKLGDQTRPPPAEARVPSPMVRGVRTIARHRIARALLRRAYLALFEALQ